LPDPLVTAVILNTNRREDTLACLESLERGDYANLSIIVLDNHSTDGSVPAIQERFPQVRIIHLQKNLGYAGNNNVGIAAAIESGAEWVFVLNEDVVLAPDAVSRLIQADQHEPRIGILGPLVYHANEPQVIQSAGGHFTPGWNAYHAGQNQPDNGQYSTPIAVDWISGCALLVRREVIQQVGMLDERFFYYWEETEWCWRAARAGWGIFLIPQAKIWHKGVQRNYQPGPNVTYYATRNRLLFLSKHHAPVKAWLDAYFTILRTLLSWSIRPRWRQQTPHRDAMWQGLNDFFRRRWGIRSSN
jgi:GT2 family glycosyltransferase